MIRRLAARMQQGPMTDLPTIAALYRYPVKGLGPQGLGEAALEPGGTMPLDRAWAIENGPSRFDPEKPETIPKVAFLMLMRNARLAALDTEFDAAGRTLSLYRDGKRMVTGALETPDGRRRVERFMAGYMADELRGPPRVVHAPGHSFSDVAAKVLHIVNLASVRELERTLGAPVDPLRFRANVYIEANEPWAEFGWVDGEIALGEAGARVLEPTTRCAATNVAPRGGARDMAIPAALMRSHGHQDFGVYAAVTRGGTLRPGDTLKTP